MDENFYVDNTPQTDAQTPPTEAQPAAETQAANTESQPTQSEQPKDETLAFGYEQNEEANRDIIIKVIGVGGGGGNAVSHMYREGIHNVSFLIINTDRQALKSSPVPNKLEIGTGLGAGAHPEVAYQYALENIEDIRHALNDGTQMVFITAGMGGGTGTGASPVVAQVAKEMGLLTVGIVTIPFGFEGKRKIKMALEGVEKIRKWVDALLIVNNDRLTKIYPDLEFSNAFSKADDTLTVAARSISEIITLESYVNLDFADIKSTLENSGVAIISTGYGEGEGRVTTAINDAVNSPLLMGNEIRGAQHLLFNLCFSKDCAVTMQEVGELTDFVSQFSDDNIEVIWGATFDNTLGNKVKMIMLASGFNMENNSSKPAPSTDSGQNKQPQPQTPPVAQPTGYTQPGGAYGTQAGAQTTFVQRPNPVEQPVQQPTQPQPQQPQPAQQPQPQVQPVQQPTQPQQPAATRVPQEVPMFEQPQQPTAPQPVVQPTQSGSKKSDDLEQIGTYYGSDMVDKIRSHSARNAYCILDDNELVNEAFIARLEQLPAHDRRREDLIALREKDK